MHSSRIPELQLDLQSQPAERHIGQGRGADSGRTRVRTTGLQEVLVKRVQASALPRPNTDIEKELRAKRRILISWSFVPPLSFLCPSVLPSSSQCLSQIERSVNKRRRRERCSPYSCPKDDHSFLLLFFACLIEIVSSCPVYFIFHFLEIVFYLS